MEINSLLFESSAMLEGHFHLSSGKHSDKYFQCAKLLQYPDKAAKALEPAAKKISEDIKTGKLKVDIVAGPALGGIIAAWELARQLNLPCIFTERDENGKMSLRRGFNVQKGQNILIVEDVVTTGKSSMECAAVLESQGAKVTGLACIVDRRAKDSGDIPLLFYPVTKQDVSVWDAENCELCKKGIPVEKPGSGKK